MTNLLELGRTLFESLFDNLPDDIVLVDKNLKVTHCNKPFLAKTGFASFADALGRPIATACTILDKCASESAIKKTFETKEKRGEVKSFIEGKKLRYYEIYYTPILKDGEVESVLCVSRDITTRKSLELKIQKQNTQLLLLQEVSDSFNEVLALSTLLKRILEGVLRLGYEEASIYLIDNSNKINVLEGVISTSFQREVRNVRIPIEEKNTMTWKAISTKLPVYIPTTTKLDDVKIDEELLHGREVNSFLALPLIIEGEVIGIMTVDNQERSLKLTEDDLKLLELFASDVALSINRAMLYDKLNNFNNELKQKIVNATRELRAKNIRLREADKIKTELLSVISHELRTPLTSIKGYSSLLNSERLGKLNQKQKESLQVVSKEADKLKRVINDVIDLSRLVSGYEQLHLELTDLNNFLQVCIAEHLESAREKGINITFEGDKDENVNCDQEKIRLIMHHLLSNAIKYNNPDGEVLVTTKNYPNFIEIKVKDTGIGIAKRYYQKIFEQFYQLEDHMTRVGTGTGVGLSIVKELVDLHHGNIDVKSEPGKYSIFTFTIPKVHEKIKKSKIEDEYKNIIDELECLKVLSNIQVGDFELKSFLEYVLESIHNIIGFERVRLYLLSKDKTRILGQAAIGTEKIEKLSVVIEEYPLIEQVLKSKIAKIYDVPPLKKGEISKVDEELGFKEKSKFAAVPLIVKDDVIGLITVDNNYTNNQISISNLESLTAFANHAATAVQNAKLYTQMESLVEERTKELRGANKKLRETDRLRNEFMSYVSHELRTPLSSLIGYAKLLQKRNLTSEQKTESIDIIHKESLRLRDMINNLLDLSKMEARKVKLKHEKVDIKELADDVITLMRPTAQKKNLSLEIEGSNTQITCDKNLIMQVFYNLLSNAIKFTSEGSIKVIVSDNDKNIQVKVKDTGIGINQNDHEKVFSKFEQIESSLEIEKGTGLGMPITKQIIESHKGKIWIESEEGEGSSFIFEIPK